ncbi:MAG: archease [Candidatus Paceibacteria bacterium]
MQQKPFEILGHTADLRLYASGKTKEELFSNMLLGMGTILNPEPIDPEDLPVRREISVDSMDLSMLLVDFLNEVLYQSTINKEVYYKVDFVKFQDTFLEAELYGKEVDKFEEDIKAVTYHEAKIQQRQDGYLEATVIFYI